MAIVVTVIRIVTLAIFAAAVVAGDDTLPLLYATVFILGAGAMAFDIAAQACLPAMVEPSELPRANGYLLTADVSGEQFAGPAIGGLAFAAAPALPFIGDAVSFVASALLVRTALPDTRLRPVHPPFLADILEGLQWFVHHRLLRLLAVAVASLAFCQAMVLSELVLYGTHELRLGQVGYGLFLAGASAGNVIGSLAAGRLHARLGAAGCLIGAAVLAGGAYLILSRDRPTWRQPYAGTVPRSGRCRRRKRHHSFPATASSSPGTCSGEWAARSDFSCMV